MPADGDTKENGGLEEALCALIEGLHGKICQCLGTRGTIPATGHACNRWGKTEYESVHLN